MNQFGPHRPAGLVTRTLSALLDLGVVIIMMWAMYAGWAFALLLFAPTGFAMPNPDPVLSTGTAIGIAVAYLTLCAAITGRTVGKVVMGLRIVLPHGRVRRWPIAFARAVLCVLFPAGLMWAAVDARRRSAQDVVLRTRVEYDWSHAPALPES
ncbi:RDD family protein [Hoyosella sp. YIM 151337]|uniref:RDD family protein n=1 Tax=Hoyosella sp. YIM 151337 TaxID=2992742 RepID=UPI002235F959|nr:RDD family protein [Hoyosella sp. YIM 151337]MCW4354148.1 RDD family protein [Hoyosella sp. YIM 151337]